MSASDDRRRAWESLIEQGIAVPVPGKTRPGPDGMPQQVYVHRDFAEKMGLPLPPLKPRRPWENEDDDESAGAEAIMTDSNLYVLEVRAGIILNLNARTPVKDGWWWGTDDEFVRGPFASYEAAIVDARRHHDKELNLIVWDKNSFGKQAQPSPRGNLIVINTEGCLWLRSSERPVSGG